MCHSAPLPKVTVRATWDFQHFLLKEIHKIRQKTSKTKDTGSQSPSPKKPRLPHWLARHVQRQNGALKDAHILVPKYCQYVTLHGKHDFAVTIKNLRWADYHEQCLHKGPYP